MFDLLAPVGGAVRRSGLVRPAAIALGGVIGIAAARHNTAHAPVVIGAALAIAVAATALRERGAALAALGVSACAAFATPSGVGPLLVAAGAVIGANPSAIDGRIAAWPEIVDAVIALPAVAGLAAVVAAQPSERAAVIAATAFMVTVGTWWRRPRHGVRPGTASLAAWLAVPVAAVVAVAPERVSWFGPVPAATRTAGHGLAAALAVFGVVCLIEAVRGLRAAPTPPQPAAKRRPAPQRGLR